MPLVKSGAKAIGKQVLKSGVGFAFDVLAGNSVKQAIDHAKAAGSSLLHQAVARKRKCPPKKVQKRQKK